MAVRLYSAAQVREFDRRAIEVCGIPGQTLMERAAQAAWRAARRRWPEKRRVVVLCGPGNNGGDGYLLACLARTEGCAVQVFEFDDLPRHGDALTARTAWRAIGDIERWNEASAEQLEAADLIVDAIYGIGFSRAPEAEVAAAIAASNRARGHGRVVLALDIPSGLLADTGHQPGLAIEADLTVTFIAAKIGLLTGQGPALTGELELATLEVPVSVHEGIAPVARRCDRSELRQWLPPRRRTGHKGDHGHVLLVGGNRGLTGAILLAGRAALRAGAGLVTVATRDSHAALLAAAQPDLMVRGVESAADLAVLLERADVVAVGPGLGTDDWSRAMFELAVSAGLPAVVDADALNLLARRASPLHRQDWLLTPHPGEAGRLLGSDTASVQRDRVAAVQALQARHGGAVVLKGAGSLIADAGGLRLCPYGNPGMGVGGMGDVLTGISAAFLAQGLPVDQAAAAAVTVHALAGDAVAASGERGLIASDVVVALRALVNP